MAISVSDALAFAQQQLHEAPGQFEARLLLSHCMAVDKVTFITHPEACVPCDEWICYQKMIQRRAQGEPVAYILGYRDFYAHRFRVSPDVLIPRPETEHVVELALQLLPQDQALHIADLGTGSGAIGISLGLACPRWHVYACDKSEAALAVARQNGHDLGAQNIQYCLGNWCEALPRGQVDAIISNPPYIRAQDPHLSQGDLPYEPQCALVGEEDGLGAYRQIVAQGREYLKPGGVMLLEHGYDQSFDLCAILEQHGYEAITAYADLAGVGRNLSACMPKNSP